MSPAPARLVPRPFGKTGLQVTPLALASLSFRADGLPRETITAAEVERAYHELGMTTFLVSHHMPQLAEGVRRLIAAGHRERLVLISISSFLPFGWAIRRNCEVELRTLGTDHLDVWLQGWVRGNWHVSGGSWPAMRALKEAGKVRAIGFSCHDRPLAVALSRQLGIDALMVRYNAAHRGASRQIFEELGADRPAIISYTATRWRMLLQPTPGFLTPMTAPECYRYVLAHPAVDLALCAAGSFDELRADVDGALAGPLDPARLEEVHRFGDAVHSMARGGARWMFRQG